MTLADIIPDLEPALKNKNPQVKEGTLKFLARSLSSATIPIQTAQIKPLAESLASLLEDGHEGARNEAAVCLGTLMKMVGERPLNATMEGLADVRKSKVKEAFEKSTVKCKLSTSAPPRAAPPAAKKTPAKKVTQPPPPTDVTQVQPIDSSESVQPTRPAAKPPARLMVSSRSVRGVQKVLMTRVLTPDKEDNCSPSCHQQTSSPREQYKAIKRDCGACTKWSGYI